MPKATRLYYLDNLKVLLIILVTMHHVGQAYGTTGGGWFYSYPGDRVKPLEFFFAFNASFFMRQSWGFPIDRWISFLGFIQMEPAHFPQYLSLFIFGALACRWSYLDSITTPRNTLWLLPGVGVFIVTVIQRYTTGHNQAFFLWPYREALLCTGVCIGLLALFKTFFDRTARILQLLSENAFGAYVLHVPVVVALQYAFDPVHAGAFTLFVIVSALSVPGSFLAAILARRIPGVKRVL
ncbi:MAG: acyltransferase family protein [Pseudomonadota bacterium]